MTIDEIKELIAVLSESDIAEFSVETNGVKLKIKKGTTPQAAPPPPPAQPVPVPAEPSRPAPAAQEPEQAQSKAGHVTVIAPMVGTFYRAPAPDADPYVKPGDAVEVGQPLCIIEAMKLMNEIESEVKGRVVEILVENGQPVEYGQPLMIIEAE